VGHRRYRSRKRRFRGIVDIPRKFGAFKRRSQGNRVALDGKEFERRPSEISGFDARIFDTRIFDTRCFVASERVAFEQRKENEDDARQNIGVWRSANFRRAQGALDRFGRCEVAEKLGFAQQRHSEGSAWYRISCEIECLSWTRCRVSLADFGQDEWQQQWRQRRRGRQPAGLSSGRAFLELKAGETLV
jgi:hypothetical protein